MSSSLIDAVRPHLPADPDVPDRLSEDEQMDPLHALAAVPDPRGRRGVRYKLASLPASLVVPRSGSAHPDGTVQAVRGAGLTTRTDALAAERDS